MRTPSAALAAAALAVTSLPAPAGADNAFAVVQGVGWYYPGLSQTSCREQTIAQLDGVLDIPVGTHAGSYSFTWDADSHGCETLLTGAGQAFLAGGLYGYVGYTRTGVAVQLTGTIYVRNEPLTIQQGYCALAVRNAEPATDYSMTCAIDLTH